MKMMFMIVHYNHNCFIIIIIGGFNTLSFSFPNMLYIVVVNIIIFKFLA